MNILVDIRKWVSNGFLKEDVTTIHDKHKFILICNVLFVYVFMQIISIVFSYTIGGANIIWFYLYALTLNVALIFLLKKTKNIKLVSILFILTTWLPTPVFIHLYGDPFLTNNLWIVALSLLSLFLLGRKWRIVTVLYGVFNLLYSLSIVIENGGVNLEDYKTTDYISGAIDTAFILVVTYVVVFQFIKFNEEVNRKNNEKNKTLERHYNIIKLQDKVKANLLKEVHHRVKNNLQMVNSMIHFQNRTTNDKNTKAILENVEQRILTMAKLHEKIYQTANFEVIDMYDYLNELVADLLKISDTTKTTYKLVVDADIKLTNETVLYVGLLVSELVINALKHAFEDVGGKLLISLKKIDRLDYELKVADNGKGFDLEVLNNLNKSLGQRLIKSFVRQINGEIVIDSNEKGSQFTIVFTELI